MSEETSPRTSGSSQRGRRRGGRRGGRNRNRTTRNESRPRSEAKSSPGKRTRSKSTASSAEAAPKKSLIKRLFGWLLPAEEPMHMRTAPAKTLDPAAGRRSKSDEAKSGRRERSRDRGERSERSERGERGERPERSRRFESAPAEEETRPPVQDKPFRIEVVSERLYVGNLPYEASEGDVFDLFSKVGEVRSVEVVQDRRNNRSKGFAFVEMSRLEVAAKAAETLNKSEFMGREIVVNGAKGERRDVEPAAPAAEAENGSETGTV